MNLDDLPGDPAPKRPAYQRKAKREDVLRVVCPVLLQYLLDGKELTTGQLFELAQVEERLGYSTSNAIGTLLGQGKSGLRLWQDKSRILAVQQNVKRVVDAVQEAGVFEDVLGEMGLSEEALAEKAAALPPLTEEQMRAHQAQNRFG